MPRQMEGWKDGWKYGQTLFYRTLLATTGGTIINFSKSVTAQKNNVKHAINMYIN